MEKPILPSLRESAGQENPKWSQHNKVPEAIHQCVHELIKIKAQIRTDAPAICAWDGHMTYGELDELSTKLAGHLVQLGVKPESFVPLCFEKSMWIVVAMLAVLKAGGAFVPLDPDTPARHNNIFQQTNATVALVSTKHFGLWNWPGHTVTINRDVISQLPERVVSSAAEPKNAAYAIFTSGSTGVPKGVVMEHLAVSTSCINHGHEFGFTISTRALQFASYTFDACIAEIITTLLFGGCICIPSDFDRRNDLVKAINTMSVNWTFLTPSVARLLNPGALPSLQTLVLGGERVTFEEWKRWSNIETMNGYGPTECCVFCVGYVRERKHTSLSKEFKSGTIGQPIASLNWLVDPEDHNRLVPHGSIGEILVEGPILARGYLNDTQKTDTSFINDPVWLLKRGRRGRLYKTGDLARYDAYDNLVYVGRKDDGQIKVRGQRVELGEIEHHLRQYDSTTKDAIVEVIKSDAGDEKSTLAAFICLEEANFIEYHIAVRDGKEFTLFKSLVEAIENHLEQVLPSHMVPTMYIPIDRVPMTTSGKTDRKKLRELGASFSSQQLTKIRNLCNDENHKTETEMEDRLRTIWARVLNLQPSDIRLEDSLLRLGGDSISAMQVVSLCRADEITLTTQDIVKEKNIRALAQLATTNLTKKVDFKSLEEEQINIPFELSPIQQMYIQAFPTQDHVFDQCFYLKLSRPVAPSVILSALETVVERHAMLRARIKQQADDTWRQSITDDIFGSLRWQNHRFMSEESTGSIIAGSRESLDFENGPVIAADLFETDSGQRFFITITHLFVDLISWRIILQDIEQLILTGSTKSSRKISFPSWCELQRTFAQSQLAPKFVLPFKIQPPMTSYWGIENHSSTWSDISKQEFSLDPQATASILGRANDWLRTEPVELFLAGLVHSFGDVFQDRNIPTMFNEGHGREPWNDQIDLSSTVGWFTTLSPLDSAATKSVNLADTIRRTKDSRRSLPYKGWGYFTSRFHNPEGIEAFEMQAPAEVLINYQGLYQQFEREDALFRRLDAPNDQDLDVSRQGGRFATFVVSIAVVSGKAIVSFMYNRHIKHQDRISQWIKHYRNTMQDIIALANNASPMYTLHDFPKTFHDYDSLDQFSSKTLPQLGISRFEDVEDVYRCSEMQQAILMNQILQPRNYWVRGAFQVAAAPGKSEICVTRLRRAWQSVVKRHAALRTTFALELPGIPGAVQIVLRNRRPGFKHVQVKHATTTVDLFSEHVAASRAERHGLEHHLSIYELPDNAVYGILEINHAIVDGHSITLLYRDLIVAYSETQKFTTPPLYSDFISIVQQEDPDKYLHYWKNYLHGVEPCLLPTKTIPDIDEGSDEVLRTHVRIEDMAALRSFCHKYELTSFSVVQVAWAVILGMFSNTTNPCFGYLSSGRHLPIDRINDLVGPTINMLTCRADVRSSLNILGTLKKVQSDSTESSANQLCSLASVHHALQLGGPSLFNTAISYQRYGDDLVLHGEEISIRRCEEHDPSEVRPLHSLGYP
jgi:amino acid adenylation domain-containing protein